MTSRSNSPKPRTLPSIIYSPKTQHDITGCHVSKEGGGKGVGKKKARKGSFNAGKVAKFELGVFVRSTISVLGLLVLPPTVYILKALSVSKSDAFRLVVVGIQALIYSITTIIGGYGGWKVGALLRPQEGGGGGVGGGGKWGILSFFIRCAKIFSIVDICLNLYLLLAP
ncbi:hypothetical protein AAMO2058_000112700 [Amorphochlora amoebiformis]